MFEKIVVPIDPGEIDFAGPAVTAASRLAAESGGEIRIIAVMPTMSGYVSDLLPADFEAGVAKETEARIHAFVVASGLAESRTSVVLRSGSVYHEVIDAAADWGADVIVLSSHRPAMSTYLIGSNAAKIVRHAPCSVLVLRG